MKKYFELLLSTVSWYIWM